MLVYQFYKIVQWQKFKTTNLIFSKNPGPDPRVKYYFVHSKTMCLVCLDQTQIYKGFNECIQHQPEQLAVVELNGWGSFRQAKNVGSKEELVQR